MKLPVLFAGLLPNKPDDVTIIQSYIIILNKNK